MCLLVVCCLILHMSPLRADALVGEIVAGTLLTVAAGTVIAATLIGLGVMPGVDSDAFDTIVDMCSGHLANLGLITNGFIDVFLHDASGVTAIQEGFVRAVADFAFSQHILDETPSLASYNGYLLPSLPESISGADYAFIGLANDGRYYLHHCQGSLEVVWVTSGGRNDLALHVSPPYSSGFAIVGDHAWNDYSQGLGGSFACSIDSIIWANFSVSDTATGEVFLSAGSYAPSGASVSSSYDLTLGVVASSGSAIADGYPDWYTGALSVDGSIVGSDAASVPFLPISLAPTYEDTRAQQQTDIWTGLSSYIAPPIILNDLNSDPVTYEQGALAVPLVISAMISGGGYLTYSWYVSVDGGSEQLIDGATSSKLIPSTDVVGNYTYRCLVSRNIPPFSAAETWSKPASVAIVVPGSVTIPDSDTVTHTGLKGLLGNLASSISDWFSRVIDEVKALPNAFAGWFEAVITNIKALPLSIADAFAGLFEAVVTNIKALPIAIADAIAVPIEAIFVPSEDFLTAKIEALRANYAFADSIIETGQAIGTALSVGDSGPPVIYMHLQDAEGDINWGGTVPALDMRWYERYKPTVDSLLSAMLWIFFAWRVFRKLPGIISGMEGDAPFEPVSDGRLGHYVSNLPRIGATSMRRRD